MKHEICNYVQIIKFLTKMLRMLMEVHMTLFSHKKGVMFLEFYFSSQIQKQLAANIPYD